jgi:hypothetical protein
VPPRDPAALGTALAELLDHPERRAQLGAAGVERARRRFTHERVAAATREIYGEVVHGRRGAGVRDRRGAHGHDRRVRTGEGAP